MKNGLKIVKTTEPGLAAYKMVEKGAIINWFEITAPEGYFSINDKISDIMSTLRGKLVLMAFIAKVFKSSKKGKPAKKGKKGEVKAAGFELKMNDGIMKMLGGFSIARIAGMLGMAGDMAPTVTKEDLLAVNAKLNKVKKPRK